MQRKTFTGMNCSIAKSLEEVGEWWTLLIVRDCTHGSTRFEEFQASLGIARNTLTTRLERMTQLGILERFPVEDRVNTNGYRLTKKGEDLYPVVVALMQWGDRWLCPGGKAPISLVDKANGRPVQKLSVRGEDSRDLSFRDVRYALGPGAIAATRQVVDARNSRVLGGSSLRKAK
jgi:DNA-binding HxlR family transcriptional regulator